MTDTTTPPRAEGHRPATMRPFQWQSIFFARLNRRFETTSAEDILRWAVTDFGAGLSLGTSFGSSGMVLIDLVLRINPDIDIFYIDTGYFFAETYDLIHRAQVHYGRTFRRVTPALSLAEHEQTHGALYEYNPDRCCNLRKVLPLRHALRDSTGWMSALRRDQAPSRSATPILRWNERHGVVKIAPLARWQEDDIWRYIDNHDVPYNDLHDQQYPSIGCWPCTRPVQDDEDIRAGRWPERQKTECGLHWDESTHSDAAQQEDVASSNAKRLMGESR